MILAAVLCKYSKIIPAAMELGAHSCYKFVSAALVLAADDRPWDAVCPAGERGFRLLHRLRGGLRFHRYCHGVKRIFIASRLNMYPVEAAIVTSCHSGLGGTGDVAILSASNRMSLMPFAQIATRIGGASTVIAATLLLSWIV